MENPNKRDKSCSSCMARQECTKCGRGNENCDRCGQGLVVTEVFGTMLCESCDNEVYEGYEFGVKDIYYHGTRWKLK